MMWTVSGNHLYVVLPFVGSNEEDTAQRCLKRPTTQSSNGQPPTKKYFQTVVHDTNEHTVPDVPSLDSIMAML